jgi:hypothetical protein
MEAVAGAITSVLDVDVGIVPVLMPDAVGVSVSVASEPPLARVVVVATLVAGELT